MPKTRPLISIQKGYLMTIASQLLNMRDVDIAIVFGTTKQNVNKMLKRNSYSIDEVKQIITTTKK